MGRRPNECNRQRKGFICIMIADKVVQKLRIIVDDLSMDSPPEQSPLHPDLEAVPARPDLQTFLSWYKAVGQRWFWWERIAMDPNQLRRLLRQKSREFYRLQTGASHQIPGQFLGFGELLLEGHKAELVFFGLAEGAIGKGFGRPFLELLCAQAFAAGCRQLTVHTCSLDHPGALSLYRKVGFRHDCRTAHIIADPRIAGFLPADLPLPPNEGTVIV